MLQPYLSLRNSVTILVAIGIASVHPATLTAEKSGPTRSLTLKLDDLESFVTGQDWLKELPPPSSVGMERIQAFEEHVHFRYLSAVSGESELPVGELPGGGESDILRRVIFIRPGILVLDDHVLVQESGEILWKLHVPQAWKLEKPFLVGMVNGVRYRVQSLLPDTAEWHVGGGEDGGAAHHVAVPAGAARAERVRLIHVLSFSTSSDEAPTECSWEPYSDGWYLTVSQGQGRGGEGEGHTARLWLPSHAQSGSIEILGTDGVRLLSKRLLPAGVLPPDLEATRRRSQWELPYRLGILVTWDTQRPSSELRRLVESGRIQPCRVLEIGCGTGNDAIYLAELGFDVTAVDISPTALAIAEKKARRAGTQVRWVLADVLHPPALAPFELIYDRGCYHELRQWHADAYVRAVGTLTRKGSRILVLAASANKDTYWRFHGPPRVHEADIRKDFADGYRLLDLREFRFDPVPPEQEGPLAWSIFLERTVSTFPPRGDADAPAAPDSREER
jgi:SAM-dependent methyltransferase